MLSDKALREELSLYGWRDSSWGNDACDSMEFVGWRGESEYPLYTLWIEDADFDMRETDGARYTVVRNAPDHTGHEELFSSESQKGTRAFICNLPEMEA